MAQTWYMYANNKFIGRAEGCNVNICNCPAIQHVDDLGIQILHEPLVMRGFNVYFQNVCDPERLKKQITEICNNCIFRGSNTQITR